jgi:hypothetical protein
LSLKPSPGEQIRRLGTVTDAGVKPLDLKRLFSQDGVAAKIAGVLTHDARRRNTTKPRERIASPPFVRIGWARQEVLWFKLCRPSATAPPS